MEISIKRNAKTEKFNKHWQFCVGSPHAVYALRRDWTQQLKTVHDELGIERVRFHGIFCDDMHTYHKLSDLFPIPGGRKITEKSFRWCAAAYDNVLLAGMKPFVELSFMPKHLAAKNKKGMFFYKPNISPPKSLEGWGEYVEEFVHFLVGRYGLEEIEGWYFEVWNEPDLKMPFFAGTKNDYFRMYLETARAIKRVSNNIRVGGPSTSGSKWVKEFISFCEENGAPLDFITTHQYAGDPLGGIDGSKEKAKININPFAAMGKDRPETLLGAFRKMMMTERVYDTLKKDNLINSARNVKGITKELPLYYTEWNLCASFSAHCNDISMAAAYVVHSVLGTSDTVDGSSIWCFTDLYEELHPFPEEFHGGFGMMTQSGIKKPVFYALKLLGELPEERIVLPPADGDATVAAFRDESGMYIVAVLPVTEALTKKEKVIISAECDSKPGSVSVLKISGDSCNPYEEWVKLGSPQVPTPTQVNIISENSKPEEKELQYNYENSELKTEILLNENEIYFIRIKY